ncbi:10542_t:CDS:2 [Acaulospora morrowiae]|uniref:10542_t:CDS:1 n=1 Tax=Acaulospora morrowiae TaxID=94023 RepID=A0A9N8VGW9_9GLOM|nr:10542_t:CDS:2 [Acaulospora morrowiae]
MYKERGLNLTNVLVSEEGLTVTYSDGHPSRWPSKITPVPDPETGDVIYYRPISQNEQKTELYLSKVGQALAKALKETQDIEVPKSVLTSLPHGYALFEHIKIYAHKEEPRKDTYLFGSSISRFRSPHEFEEHLLWMASDKANRCICKYCSPFGYEPSPRKQKNINTNSINTSSINSYRNAKSGSGGKSLASRIVTVSEGYSSSYVTRGITLESETKNASSSGSLGSVDNNSIDNRFRRGEVVWVNIESALNLVQQRQLVIQVGDDRIKYWPAAVVDRKKAPYVSDPSVRIPQESITLYHLQVLLIGDVMDLRQKAILPWHILDPDEIIHDFEKVKYTARDELVVKFVKAVTNAIRVVTTYTPLMEYRLPPSFVNSAADERQRSYYRRLQSFLHYKTMFLGPESLKINDLIRIKRPDEKDPRVREKQPVFRLKRIYADENECLKMIGDIYIKMPKDDGGVKLVKMNPDYDIDIAQIAGRCYTLYPAVKCNTRVKEQMGLNQRISILKKGHSPSLEVQQGQTDEHVLPISDNSIPQRQTDELVHSFSDNSIPQRQTNELVHPFSDNSIPQTDEHMPQLSNNSSSQRQSQQENTDNYDCYDHYDLMDTTPIFIKKEEIEDVKIITSLVTVKEENTDDMMDLK